MAQAGSPAPVVLSSPCSTVADLHYRNIPVVDGDAASRKRLAEWLISSGHFVLTAASSADALTYLMETDVDLVITEYSMGRVSGQQWLKFLDEHYRRAEVLIVTNLPSRMVRTRHPILRKPLALGDLQEHMSSLASA